MNRIHGVFRLLVLFVGMCFLPLSGCDCDGDAASPTKKTCTTAEDCPGAQECINGRCVTGTDASSNPDAGPIDDSGSPHDADTSLDVSPDGGEPDTGPACEHTISCAEQGVECGSAPDGCGGTIQCAPCPEGHSCGTGADRGRCIAIECTPTGSCEDQDLDCGTITDGCGGSINCGTCLGGQICGVGASRGRCVDPGSCTPITTCEGTGKNCGTIADGCGGTVACGVCSEGQVCGTGAQRGICQDVACTPRTCNDIPGAECGPFTDGCGGQINCGTCTGGQICGTGAQRGQCVASPCVPKDCSDYNHINCGQMSDGCDGFTGNCGDCVSPEICGGGGAPNVCSAENRGTDCENLCQDQAICFGGQATTLTGTVYAPNGTLPIPNAVVYVPNVPLDQLPAIETGVSCVRCEDEDLGSPLVGTVTNFDGTFELRHVPAGVEFPLVIKVGKWRRVVMIPPQAPCQTNSLSSVQTRLPRAQNESSVHDNIPHTAISTGRVDAIECVLYKLGVERDQFSRRSQDGRIHLYRANGGTADAELRSACNSRSCWSNTCTDRDNCGTSTSTAATLLRDNLSNRLYESQAILDSYDMVVFDCEGSNHINQSSRTAAHRARILQYVNQGGRLFASHLAFDWLYTTSELTDSAVWYGTHPNENQSLAYVDTSHQRGMVFWSWLQLVGAHHSINPPQINIADPRFFVTDVQGDSVRWVHTVAGAAGHSNADAIQQYSFDTPVHAAQGDACGRVVYSAFHVDQVSTHTGNAFPTYCTGGDLSPQEKVLAFMLFDLAACVSDDGEPPPPICEPLTCADMGAQCGIMSDGCGGVTANCGTCPDGTACGAGGVPNVCGGACTRLTCADHGADCGTVDDGCGGTLDCGTCTGDMVCGGSGVANTCACSPLTCADHGAQCGEVLDGCGGVIECGDCADGQVCGRDTPNICAGDCSALTCADHGAECGTVADGCGGTRNCGSCEAPLSCGGAGVPNSCGMTCEPLTCEDHGAECGTVSNGCGDTLECGECPELMECRQLMCVTPACLPANESCVAHSQCCSEICAFDESGESGICISN